MKKSSAWQLWRTARTSYDAAMHHETALVLQHVPFEGPAAIGSWLRGRGWMVERVRLWLGDRLPAPERYRLIVVIGGPMSVNETRAHPWLLEECRFLERAVSLGVPTLGVCLGAQLIASALGQSIYRGSRKEIGWWPVELVPEAAAPFWDGRARATVFHWHSDTFDLPSGATRIASSPVTPNQAFVYQRNVVGLQFHLESTLQSVRSLTAACLDEIERGTYQPGRSPAMQELLQGVRLYSGTTRALLTALLDDLTGHEVTG